MPLFAPKYDSDGAASDGGSDYNSDDEGKGRVVGGKPPNMDYGGVRGLTDKEKDALEASAREQVGDLETHPLAQVPPARHDLTHPWATYRMPEGVDGLCVDFSPNGHFVAVGCRDGCTRIIHAGTGEHGYTVGGMDLGEPVPHTSVRFRPEVGGFSTGNVLLVGTANGVVQHYHATSGNLMSSYEEPGTQVFVVEYRADGTQFATAGLDGVVRVYDEGKGQPRAAMVLKDGDGAHSVGHSSRVYSLTWHPEDPNVLMSAGWDRTVQIWDLRQGRAVRSIFGPYVCGNAMEFDAGAGELITGSWRTSNALQVYDYGSGALKTNLPVDGHGVEEGGAGTMLYAIVAGRDGLKGSVVAGGSGTNVARVVERATGRLQASYPTEGPVHALAFSPQDPTALAICTNDALQLATVAPHDGL